MLGMVGFWDPQVPRNLSPSSRVPKVNVQLIALMAFTC